MNTIASFRQSLQTYSGEDSLQNIYKNQMLDFLERYQEAAFVRETLIGHFTGSAFVVNQAGTHCLLLQHTKLQMWLQPGGHCDGDADVLAVAVRETEEETGIVATPLLEGAPFDIDIHAIPERKHEPAHLHFDVRYLLQATDDQLIKNDESQALAWFSCIGDHSLPTTSPSIVRMVAKYIALKERDALFLKPLPDVESTIFF